MSSGAIWGPLSRLQALWKGEPALCIRHHARRPTNPFYFGLWFQILPAQRILYIGGVEEQLELATASFVNNQEVEIIPSENLLRIPQILRSYRRDFVQNRRSIIQFLLRYLDGGQKKDFLQSHQETVKARYRDYDWNLNH